MVTRPHESPESTNQVLFSRATRPFFALQHPHVPPPIGSFGRILCLAILRLRPMQTGHALVGASLINLERMIMLFAFDMDTLRFGRRVQT